MTATIAVTVVAVLHLAFLILEMFLWNRPTGRRIFGLTREFAEQSAALAANQGLYNGFLAAGLVWGISRLPAADITVFFLVCIIVAGVYGAWTVKPVIFLVQALPGIVALLLVLYSG